ncbi:MAG: hypothetical protein R3324_10265, partial [Halobacteriales archaeon]|nr:hypothetical protein [Halobacteriales archaeon]
MPTPVKRLYNSLLRPHLPRKIAVYNGVPVRNVKLLDTTDEFPDYEAPLVEAIRRRVRPGDAVTIVGGGLGVGSVVAARAAGIDGTVQTFEASESGCRLIRETLVLNRATDLVDLTHAIVGDAVDVHGPIDGAIELAPEDLPEGDVLVLDCEGAELGIMTGRDLSERVVVVE